jgi:uncharacterized coiled-coil DUF342 family protein
MSNAEGPQIHDRLELLENGIKRLIQKISDLSEQNTRLKKNAETLRDECDDYMRKAERADQAASEADYWKAEAGKLTTSRAHIAGKVESLLNQIDSLQMDLSDVQKPENLE